MTVTVAEIDSIEPTTDTTETTVEGDDHIAPLECTSGYSSYCTALK